MVESIIAPDGYIIAIIAFLVLLAVAIVGVAWVLRALVRRTTRVGGKSIAAGLIAAFTTAGLVFMLTYCSAWTELRQQVAMGGYGDQVRGMKNDFSLIRNGLSEFAREHGCYPETLDEVKVADLNVSLKDWRPVDPWGNPYQYRKTENGFRLFSLGRDGKPGGTGLDADIYSDSEANIRIDPTLSQFLFEATGSDTLFTVALIASLCAGLTCFLASGPRQGRGIGGGRLLLSIALATITAVGVSIFLVSIYLLGEHH